jgi:hypothetical protein
MRLLDKKVMKVITNSNKIRQRNRQFHKHFL